VKYVAGLIVAIIACMTAVASAGESMPRFVIKPSPHIALTAKGVGEAQVQLFTKHMQNDPDLKDVAPFALVVTNIGDKPVTVIAVKWTIKMPSRAPTVQIQTSDSYSLPRSKFRPVIDSHRNLLIAPTVVESEGSAAALQSGQAHIAQTHPRERLAEFAAAEIVEVEIDCVVFDDGEVAGPDTTRMRNEVVGRNAAASRVSSAVRSAVVRGESPGDVLANMSSSVVGG
jgi:hypothetical protein